MQRPAPLITVCILLFVYAVGLPFVKRVDTQKFQKLRHSVTTDYSKLGVELKSFIDLRDKELEEKWKKESRSSCRGWFSSLCRMSRLRISRDHLYVAVFRRDPNQSLVSVELWLALLMQLLTLLAINALFYGTAQDASSLPTNYEIGAIDPALIARGMMPGFPDVNAFAQGLVLLRSFACCPHPI